MPIVNSKTGKVRRYYTVKELEEKAREMRAYNMTAITAAGSGHTGGTLSIMDIAAALYLKVARHDPRNPNWSERDRIIWSAGHKAPALYVALAEAGYFPIERVMKLRKLDSGFEGHPHRLALPGIELSAGSLGQGLGVAVGSALNAKLEKKNYRVFCIMGDGEQQEGSVWEAVMSAAHYKLNNLVGIIDRNKLQIDGPTEEVMKIAPLDKKYRAFGWRVITACGHDIKEILDAFKKARKTKGKPTVIIANTIKGKGVTYAENVVGYHGIAPKDGRSGRESLDKALEDIGDPQFTKERVDELLKVAEDYQKEVDQKIEKSTPRFSKDYWWNSHELMRVEMEPTRNGFGRALDKLGKDPKVIALGADITGSIRMDQFFAKHPDRIKRFFSMGIAEQNMTTVAAGLAKEGKIVFIGSYGVFICGRNWDQIRTTLCYNKLNVKIADAHGGVSVGPDGATHQALEEISNMYYLPNMKIVVPSDARETELATMAIAKINGPAVIRYAREKTPVVTTKDTPYLFGVANILRFRKKAKNFIDAFEIKPSTDYKNEYEHLSIIACGPVVAEAMRAAWILKEEYGIDTRVINIHTLKPIDKAALVRAAEETPLIVTVEEHQVGGFGNIVAGVIGQKKDGATALRMKMVGVPDRFGKSGQSWELIKLFGLSAEHIAKKAGDFYGLKASES